MTFSGFKIKNFLHKTIELISIVFLIHLCFFPLFISSFTSSSVFALDNKSERLISKISKDYTKKFCNGIAFGLSKDSAMDFAIKENNLIYQKRIVEQNIEDGLLASEIAESVVDRCGYPLNLIGNKGVVEFKKYYMLVDKITDKENN